MENMISEEKIQKYFEVTGKALKKVHPIAPKKSHMHRCSDDFFDMATRYYKDAEYFYQQGDIVNAFAALNYAHGWLDAGARLGIWDVGYDSQLFTVEDDS